MVATPSCNVKTGDSSFVDVSNRSRIGVRFCKFGAGLELKSEK